MSIETPFARPITIPGAEGILEALWADPARGLAPAVLCHPHPGHGGTMHSRVVHTLFRVLHEAGHPTLRFNFRGAGASEGAYSGGNAEVDDLAAAIAYARGRTGRDAIWIGGFSFGAWIALQWVARHGGAERCVALGVAAGHHEFDFLERAPAPLLIVQGERDRYGPLPAVRALVRRLAPSGDVRLRVVAGADHFFTGALRELKRALREELPIGPNTAG